MIHLVTGGSGSGKSEYAENWLTGRNKKDGTYIYIATMQPYTEETMKKIERHHRLRAGKGFRTLEKYTDLSELEIPKNQGILLECISNLVANELYREDGTLNDLKETKEKVFLNDFATIATKAFEEGYDLRFGVAMAIPVLVTELSIRLIWSIKVLQSLQI